MKTMQADLSASLERNNAAFERLRADMAKHREDAAKREPRMIVTVSAIVIGGGGLAVAFLALLIGLPG
ncbi:MAG: hypothetical protein OXF07_06955 [Rhodobacter sp.]|nr:hypothetical protein [Rhodobacter sp.]MCY4169649.1 hypothetical protein [Rhodobacter sp.]MCY4240968.1 hypothetical protein [Rhodobacter sp.]